MLVMKFGGTSVADAEAIGRVARIVARAPESRLVVVSALSGVTDRLLDVARLAGAGERDTVERHLRDLRACHLDAATVVRDPAARAARVADLGCAFDALDALVRALAVLREVTPRSLDAVAATGELTSSRLVAAALSDAGLDVLWLDPRRVLVTDDHHLSATPLLADTAARLRDGAGGWLDASAAATVVTGGFVGATADGVTTTLGRGGSDYSAAIFGACLGAREIQIWTDVDGMLTADPRVVPDARVVARLSAAEAAELAYFGAKVLHPATIAPALSAGVPVRILNSSRPDAPGSLVTAKPPDREAPLAAIACKRGVAMIDVTSNRMLRAYGFLRRLFEVFERFETSVDVVTTSEVSVSVTLDDGARLPEIVGSLREFADVSYEPAMALICLVGEGLRANPTLTGAVLAALDGVTVRMVSQAASRRNLTIVLRDEDLPAAMARLHDRFFPSARRAPEAREEATGSPRAGADGRSRLLA